MSCKIVDFLVFFPDRRDLFYYILTAQKFRYRYTWPYTLVHDLYVNIPACEHLGLFSSIRPPIPSVYYSTQTSFQSLLPAWAPLSTQLNPFACPCLRCSRRYIHTISCYCFLINYINNGKGAWAPISTQLNSFACPFLTCSRSYIHTISCYCFLINLKEILSSPIVTWIQQFKMVLPRFQCTILFIFAYTNTRYLTAVQVSALVRLITLSGFYKTKKLKRLYSSQVIFLINA